MPGMKKIGSSQTVAANYEVSKRDTHLGSGGERKRASRIVVYE